MSLITLIERLAFRFLLKIAFLFVAIATTAYITLAHSTMVLLVLVIPYDVGSLGAKAYLGFVAFTGWVTLIYLFVKTKSVLTNHRKK
jgi:hypothetical protein